MVKKKLKIKKLIMGGMVFILVCIYMIKFQPFLRIDRLSIFNALYGKKGFANVDYLFAQGNPFLAYGYQQFGHIFDDESLDFQEINGGVFSKKALMLGTITGVRKQERSRINTEKYDMIAETTKIGESDVWFRFSVSEPYVAFIYFEKGDGAYFIELQDLTEGRAEVFRKMVIYVLEKLLKK